MRMARDQKTRKATNKTKYACKTKEQVVQKLRLASNKIKMLMQWKQRAKARLQVMKKDVVNLRAKMSEIAKSTTLQNIQDKMKIKMDSKVTLL
ncbi:putative Cell division protein ftsj [Daphnia magna]|uniref:Putative Cell division protein ftsj n=1 Tax=Daphnia magna TaxID=35525 RepID=A0A164SJU0_9CRUS|nr:putative Cell division protein ftsj [Daphnia magna]